MPDHNPDTLVAKKILLNGEAHETTAQTMTDLLARLGIKAEMPGVAVAHNGRVAPRLNWPQQIIQEHDIIELISANVGG